MKGSWRGGAGRGGAWRGVAWRGVAWRGVAGRGGAWRGGAGRGGVTTDHTYYSPHAPQVNRAAVELRSEQELGRAVPSGHHL
jgi:hypothetical protein